MIRLEPEEAILFLDSRTSDEVVKALVQEHYPATYQDLYDDSLRKAIYALKKLSYIDSKMKYNDAYRRVRGNDDETSGNNHILV